MFTELKICLISLSFAINAEERAIGIVSTGIFDAGSSDEFLLEMPVHRGDARYDEDGRMTGGGGSKGGYGNCRAERTDSARFGTHQKSNVRWCRCK